MAGFLELSRPLAFHKSVRLTISSFVLTACPRMFPAGGFISTRYKSLPRFPGFPGQGKETCTIQARKGRYECVLTI